jgi:hypothetical protein
MISFVSFVSFDDARPGMTVLFGTIEWEVVKVLHGMHDSYALLWRFDTDKGRVREWLTRARWEHLAPVEVQS